MTKTVSDKLFEKNAIEAAIKIGILGAMVIGTVRIIHPFLMPVAWAIIIAVAMEPFIGWFALRLGGRRKLASVLFALLVIAILVIPSIMMATSSIDAVQTLSANLENGSLTVPPPPEGVKEWPVIGPSVSKTWTLASTNLAAALKQFGPQLKAGASALLGSVGGGLKAVFMFVISVIIAAVLLATAEKGSLIMTRIISRFVGEKGPKLVTLATATIRGVMQGVVGVAIIQAVLSAIGMAVVGVPAAGLWAILVLVLAVIQLPPIIVLAPIAGWVFSFADTVPAVIFLVWALLVSASDGFLKPLLMGRGVDAPMLVILIGALGGMMLSGIIGLFVGAVVVAISYTLFMAWVEEHHLASTVPDTVDND
jgi:predicted PurR-regulated permease PerM